MSFAWLWQIPDILEKASLLIKVLSSLQARFRGDPYEVLENEIELEILDVKGKVAKYRKRKKIRFLQNNIFAYLDTVFGDGKIFEDYECSPGKAVDFYEDGDRYRVLISLQKMNKHGDTEEIHISRSIHNGYREPKSYLQTDITYMTRDLEVRIIFPAKRFPKTIYVVEKHSRHTYLLSSENISILSDKRYLATWQKKFPRLNESYILLWHW